MEAGPSGMAKLDGHNEKEIQRKIPMKLTDELLNELIGDKYQFPESGWFEARDFFEMLEKEGKLPDQSNPHYSGISRCWSWCGRTLNGYAVMTRGGKTYGAHRFSYRFHHGEIPEGMVIRHRCDNKICTNPDHLEIGTPRQNAQEAHERGLVRKGRIASKACQTSKDKMPFLIAGSLANEFGRLLTKMHSPNTGEREDAISEFRDKLYSIFRDCYAMSHPERKYLHPKEAKKRILSLNPFEYKDGDEYPSLSDEWSQDLDDER